METKQYGPLKFNYEALRDNVSPALNDSEKNLKDATERLFSTTVPTDFNYYTTLKGMPERILNIRDNLISIEKWVNSQWVKLEYAEKINEMVINVNLNEFLEENEGLIDAKVLEIIREEVILQLEDKVVEDANLREFIAENQEKLDSETMGEIVSEVLLRWARIITDELIANDIQYSLTDGLIANDIAAATDFTKDGVKCCCATYISAILYRSGALPEDSMNQCYYHGTASNQLQHVFNDAINELGWQKVENAENVQPGDICIKNDGKSGHIFMYVGGGYYIDTETGKKVYYDDDCIWDESSGCTYTINNEDGTTKIINPLGGPELGWQGYVDSPYLQIWRIWGGKTTDENE